jgi:hypothetical protein
MGRNSASYFGRLAAQIERQAWVGVFNKPLARLNNWRWAFCHLKCAEIIGRLP